MVIIKKKTKLVIFTKMFNKSKAYFKISIYYGLSIIRKKNDQIGLTPPIMVCPFGLSYVILEWTLKRLIKLRGVGHFIHFNG